MNQQQKDNIRKAKLKYYEQFNGKRPYKFQKDYNGRKIEFPNVIDLIEKFNALQREYGEINENIINKEFGDNEVIDNKLMLINHNLGDTE